jgi:protein arginine kinase activator
MPCPCQLCPSPEATVHLTEVAADGTRQELHLCRACVARLHLRPDQEAPDLALLRQQVETPAEEPAAPPLLCDACGLDLAAYAETNLFGCPQCYESFDTAVMALLERYHGASAHQGRLPLGAPAVVPAPPRKPRGRPTKAARRAALEARLREAVAEERYEEAARLRDDLKILDGGA